MTTQPRKDGRRPIDRVLAPGFTDDLADVDGDELRARRLLAEQEEVDLSYARRLLQGRIDLVREQQNQLASGRPAGSRTDAELVKDLAAVLADSGPRSDHGLGRHLHLDPTRVGEHRRAAEQAVASLETTGDQDAAHLDSVVVRLHELERDVSESRHRVQQVVDVLTAEVARRYKSGEAHVEDAIPEDAPAS